MRTSKIRQESGITDMKKKIIATLLLVVIAIGSFGCKKKSTEKEEVTPTPTDSPVTVAPSENEEDDTTVTGTIVDDEENHEGMVRSKLTGEWIDEAVGNLRPYAIMINNIINANPQSGLSEAAIIYEALAEGGITRFLAIYDDLYDEEGNLIEKIGSCRSARHYYASFADEYDAIFVHYGETKYATSKIKQLGLDTLSGLTGIGTTVFYEDNSKPAPHHIYTSGEGILAGTQKKGYRTEYNDGYEGHFQFYTEDTDLDSTLDVNKLTLKYSNFKPYFVYDEETKLYQRYQFGDEHIDATTGEQLTFKNIIVQFVNEYNKDKNGYQTMDIENNKGEGYYITNGQAIPITWKKNESSKKMRYYNQAGEELVINPGKTFISIFPDAHTDHVVFE